mmetsp:Transcript_66559/g.214505  ORF Transcript_66559/g.214505 Transcript_66559/m.214505 type:complete len:294 (+) Transcript_66559:452-1333(+)
MADGMAIVERRPQASLLLIDGNNLCLVGHGLVKHLLQQRVVEAHDAFWLGYHKLKELRIPDDAHLDGLRETLNNLAAAEGAEHLRVGKDELRLVEGPDQVLAGRHVQGGLATNAGVDHRHRRCGDLHGWHPAHVCRGDKAGQITHDATAECHDNSVARALACEHEILDVGLGLAVLGGLPRLEGKAQEPGARARIRCHACASEGRGEPLAVVPEHGLVAHDDEGAGLQAGGQHAAGYFLKEAPGDQHAAVAYHLDLLHFPHVHHIRPGCAISRRARGHPVANAPPPKARRPRG